MNAPFGSIWDWLLVIVVSLQATTLAYLHHPFWKAFVMNLPLPFTLAMLSLGQPFDVTNIAGFGLLLLYYHVIRLAYRGWRLNIFLSIAIATGLHLCLAMDLSAVLPRGEVAFWLVMGLVVLAAVAFHTRYPVQIEEGYRTPLPVWIKLPAIMLVTASIILIKGWLQGFMTAFPMVSLIAAYEGRFMLGTLCRQMPILVFTMLPMLLTIRFVQPYMGYQWSLVPAWMVFLITFIPIMRSQWRQYRRGAEVLTAGTALAPAS